MKSENSEKSPDEMVNKDEHDLFHLLKTAEGIKVIPNIPIRDELTTMELAVYNFLLHHEKDFPCYHETFTLELLRNRLDSKYSDDDLVDAFRNLDKKYYTECAFDDKGNFVWVKLL